MPECGEDDPCDLTLEELQALFPNVNDADLQLLIDLILEHGVLFGLIDEETIAHFIAQVAHESGGLTNFLISEGLNYTTAEGLVKVWQKRFSLSDSTLTNPTPYIQNPEGLANFVYSNRMGNGNPESGDGWFFRGRGIMQITGRNNYQQFNNFYQNHFSRNNDFVSNPNLLTSDKEASIIAAMWFFKTYVLDKLNELTVEKVTRRVNGGIHGLDNRTNYFNNTTEEIEC